MKNQAYTTNGQQSKKPGSGKWLRWTLLVLVLGLLVGDGVLSGRWSDITLAGTEDETVVTPSELVTEDEVEEPELVIEPEVTETAEKEEEITSEAGELVAEDETAQDAKQENEQEQENNEQTEQDTALVQEDDATMTEETALMAEEEVVVAEDGALATEEELLVAEKEESVTEEAPLATGEELLLAEEAPLLTDEELLVTEEEEPAAERTVTIYSNLEDTIGVNDTFEMSAELSGFEDVSYTVQWQRDEGFGWEDISGATDLVLELPASALDIQSSYRLVVNVAG